LALPGVGNTLARSLGVGNAIARLSAMAEAKISQKEEEEEEKEREEEKRKEKGINFRICSGKQEITFFY